MTKPLCFVFGTRPEIIKCSPLIAECARRDVPFFIVHTGQHYDAILDRVFFEELELPAPEYHLHVGADGLRYPAKLGHMVAGIEPLLRERVPSVVVVQGDTTSALAGALAAKRVGLPVAHLESGLRSQDYAMTEEWNRIMIDKVADYYFVPTEESRTTMLAEYADANRIHVVGNSVVDAVNQHCVRGATGTKELLTRLNLSEKTYILATIHRAENVDDPERLRGVLEGIARAATEAGLQCVLPLHPRTKHKCEAYGVEISDAITVIEPLGYTDFLGLESNARLIITDSGGIQEEASILRIPCVTVRDNTERPETVEAGMNMIGGTTPDTIAEAAKTMLAKDITWSDLYGDGQTAKRVLDLLTS